jgi:glycosyltransferase involved in cell wall biosynthesis
LFFGGRLAREKNVGLLIDTLERLEQSYTLHVIGDGPERESFERESSRRVPGRIRIHGHVSDRSEYKARLCGADVFLHPNPNEPFGIGPLEAMACGIPVVAPDSGGILSYANGRTAWLSKPTPEAMANAVRSVFDDPIRREETIRRARQTAEEHDWTIVTKRFFDLLDALHEHGWAAGGLLCKQ